MKKNILLFLFTFSCFLKTFCTFAADYPEVKKLYDLYSEDILEIAQLDSAFKNIGIDDENLKNLFVLRKEAILSENDFINGVKKILDKNNDTINNTSKNDSGEGINNKIFNKDYTFQTVITDLSQYVVGDFNYGDIFDHKVVFENKKITEIYLKQNDIELVKFTKPKLKILNDNKFIIKSNIIDPTEPSAPLKYVFKGSIEENKIKGKLDISYFGNDLPSGTILIKAKIK